MAPIIYILIGFCLGGLVMAICFAQAETNPKPPYGHPIIQVDDYEDLERMLTENNITFIKRTEK